MRFSRRQRQALLWWVGDRRTAAARHGSAASNLAEGEFAQGGSSARACQFDGIICHGAVRSGKTTACALGFVLWATCSFDRRDFAICGKSRDAVRRNLALPAIDLLRRFGFAVEENISSASFTVRCGQRSNTFRLFGGMNEASAALIQGITLAGVLFDEVTLMPQSFVSQAMARCSLEGSKVWFCCNPDSPAHWFKREYVDRAAERRLKVLHFRMSDNPSLSPETRERYHRQFAGRFFRRYVLGYWEAPEGLVYDFMEDGSLAAEPPPEPHERYVISVDYGTANPSSFGLWGLKDGVWWRIREFYHDGRAKGSLTDEEYADRLDALAGGRRIDAVIVDPSARSFITALRRRGCRVRAADNRVADGIRRTAAALKSGRVRISPACREAWREFALYRWKDGAGEEVVKQHDHAMDEIRYFVMSAIQ